MKGVFTVTSDISRYSATLPLPHSSSLSAVGSSPQRLCVSGSAAVRKDDQEDVTAESRASGAENPNKKKSVIMRCEFSVSKIRFSFFYFRHSASDFLTLRIYAVKSPNGSGVGWWGWGRGGEFFFTIFYCDSRDNY